MLLNNFRRVMVNGIVGGLASDYLQGMTGEIKTTGGTLYNPSGDNYKDTPSLSNANTCSIAIDSNNYDSIKVPASGFSFSGYQIFLGAGDTSPTINDYKLSGELITGLTSQNRFTTANNYSFTFSAIATNNTDTPVTIKEIGLGGYTSGTYVCAVLLTRDVLPAPVTLNTGDSKTFSITIDFRSLTDSTINV